jgi:TonB family protein
MFSHPATSSGIRPAPIVVSLLVHAGVLGWVAFGPPAAAEKRESAYQREIAPHEQKLVWYRFNNKLPEVSPAKPVQKQARKLTKPSPVRAAVKHPKQTIVAKSEQPDPAKQLILAPGPVLKIPVDLAAPNLMAFKMPELPSPPAKPKPFTAPPETPLPAETPKLESGPEIAAQLPAPAAEIPAARPAKPEPKKFTPPPQVVKRVETPQLQPGEAIASMLMPDANALAAVPRPARPTPKKFAPPPNMARTRGPAPLLSAGPALAPQTPTIPKPTEIAGLVQQPARPTPKLFTPPSPRKKTGAPESDSPVLDIPSALASNLNVAVVGLNPIDKMPVVPEGSRPAQFSAAPELSPKGDEAAPPKSANIVMKDLMISGGAEKADKQDRRESIARLTRVQPTSRENLLAAARPSFPRSAPIAAMQSLPPVQVPAAPDPRLEGRVIYTVAIQMPNVTSYSGSWILWYAERKSDSDEQREVLPPEPLRKVDPVYDLSAVEDRVEGKVQLAAIIHTDGYVYGINVVKGLDPRLDKNATEALRKWEFTPARRNGTPVDVDIVIEIPFRLRPLK